MSLTAEEIRECTMIALDQPPFYPKELDAFVFTIYVDGSTYNRMNFTLYAVLNDFYGTIFRSRNIPSNYCRNVPV